MTGFVWALAHARPLRANKYNRNRGRKNDKRVERGTPLEILSGNHRCQLRTTIPRHDPPWGVTGAIPELHCLLFLYRPVVSSGMSLGNTSAFYNANCCTGPAGDLQLQLCCAVHFYFRSGPGPVLTGCIRSRPLVETGWFSGIMSMRLFCLYELWQELLPWDELLNLSHSFDGLIRVFYFYHVS